MEASNKPNWKTIPAWVQVIQPNTRGAWLGYDALPKYTRCVLLGHAVFKNDTLTTYDIEALRERRARRGHE